MKPISPVNLAIDTCYWPLLYMPYFWHGMCVNMDVVVFAGVKNVQCRWRVWNANGYFFLLCRAKFVRQWSKQILRSVPLLTNHYVLCWMLGVQLSAYTEKSIPWLLMTWQGRVSSMGIVLIYNILLKRFSFQHRKGSWPRNVPNTHAASNVKITNSLHFEYLYFDIHASI